MGSIKIYIYVYGKGLLSKHMDSVRRHDVRKEKKEKEKEKWN